MEQFKNKPDSREDFLIRLELLIEHFGEKYGIVASSCGGVEMDELRFNLDSPSDESAFSLKLEELVVDGVELE